MADHTTVTRPVFSDMSQYRQPLTYELAGKDFTFHMDNGHVYEIHFEREELSIGPEGGDKCSYYYEAMKGDEITYFVSYQERTEMPRKSVTFVIDLQQDLVTEVDAFDGWNPEYPHMTKTENIFGAIKREDGTYSALRHGYTEDMVGRAIHWNYGNIDVIHVYQSPRYYRLVIPESMLERFKRISMRAYEAQAIYLDRENIYEDSCDYIKIKDDMYIFSINEQNINRAMGGGSNLLFLMNLYRMYDVGRAFGSSMAGELQWHTFSAYGEYVDESELMALKSTRHVD